MKKIFDCLEGVISFEAAQFSRIETEVKVTAETQKKARVLLNNPQQKLNFT